MLKRVKQYGMALEHASADLQEDEELKAAAQHQRKEKAKKIEAIAAAKKKSFAAEAKLSTAVDDKGEVSLETPPVGSSGSNVGDNGDKLHPLKFEEQNFVLKASATQLVSTYILLFYLLPFLDQGFPWWLDGTKAFLTGSFDPPRLQYH